MIIYFYFKLRSFISNLRISNKLGGVPNIDVEFDELIVTSRQAETIQKLINSCFMLLLCLELLGLEALLHLYML